MKKKQRMNHCRQCLVLCIRVLTGLCFLASLSRAAWKHAIMEPSDPCPPAAACKVGPGPGFSGIWAV